MATLSLVLALLAWASPGDPTWLPGVYDNGDFDDAILALLSLDGSPRATAVAVETLEAGWTVLSRSLLTWSPPLPDAPSKRAPPLA
jgi:hypothetical protein